VKGARDRSDRTDPTDPVSIRAPREGRDDSVCGACHYDVRRKCYVASNKMQTVLHAPNFSEDMEVIGAAMVDTPESGEFVLCLSRPARVADQRTALKMDYGMKDGRLKLAAKRALAKGLKVVFSMGSGSRLV